MTPVQAPLSVPEGSPATEIHVARHGQVIGKWPRSEISWCIAANRIVAGDYWWAEGEPGWVRFLSAAPTSTLPPEEIARLRAAFTAAHAAPAVRPADNPAPARVPASEGIPWWAWAVSITVIVLWVVLSGANQPSHTPAPTAEQMQRTKLEQQWESVVAARRQRDADFEKRTRPH